MRKHIRVLQLLFCLAMAVNLLFAFSIAQAHTLPNAGSIEQEVEKQLPQQPTNEDPEKLLSAPKQIKPASGPSFTLVNLRFIGNAVVTSEQLQTLIKPYLDKPVDFNGLQNITAEIAEFYRASGRLARVYLPRQEIVNGSVTMQIVEARMGRLRVDGDVSERLRADLAQQYVNWEQPVGELLSVDDLDRALLLINDLPGVNVSGNLAAGENRGETDLLLKTIDQNLVSGSVSVANIGARSTGREQVGVNLYLNSPSQVGDQAQLNLLKTEGLNYGRIGYNVPYKYSGLQLGINATKMNYDVVTPEFKALALGGEFNSWGIQLSYPLLRSRTQNLNLTAHYDNKRYQNNAADLTTSDYRIRNFVLGANGSFYDAMAGGSANQASLRLTLGDLDLGVVDFSENRRLAGQFTKVNWGLSRRQFLAPDWTVNAQFSGQWADSNLDSSEKFYLGGAYGVRAYPSNEGGGDRGYRLSADVSFQARAGLTFSAFVDWGRVRRNLNNGLAQASPNRYELSGLGLSAQWFGPSNIQLNASYSHRLGDNPNPTPDGNDQDGSLKSNRFWLVASYSF